MDAKEARVVYAPPAFVPALVSVCCRCRKDGRGLVLLGIRPVDAAPMVSHHLGSAPSDGYCPECFADELRKVREWEA